MAPMIDMTVLSFEEARPPKRQAKGAQVLLPTSLAVIPVVDQHRRGVELVGTF